MPRWPAKVALAAGAAAVLLAIPAFGQQAEDSPQSLLPEGFGEPPPPADRPGAPAAAPGAGPTSLLPPTTTPAPTAPTAPAAGPFSFDDLTDEQLAALEASLPKPIEMPDFARRPVDFVGPLTPRNWGFATDAWGATNGRFLSTLMRRVDAPLPSRWTSILLRRALLSQVPAPRSVNPVDWVAERAWLLVRMGEADGARMLVQAVDVDQFTPKMFQVAVQTGLATADPAALCPLVAAGRDTSDEAVWQLSEAMCAGLRGDSAQASTLIDRARRRNLDPIDVILAEKIVGAGTDARRSVSVQWENVDRVNSWRFGLAAATGLAIPDRLMNGANGRVWAWQARAPMVPLDQRLAAADRAAALGVFSNRSLVDIYSLLGDITDPSEMRGSVAERLRTAYAAPSLNGRLDALKSLWSEGQGADRLYARRILTAVAASRLRPTEVVGDSIDDLIASMLSAGLDERAARWANVVEAMDGEPAERAWAMLAVSSPRPIAVSGGRIGGYGDAVSNPEAGRLLLAGLAGLGRIGEGAARSMADDMGINLLAQNSWTRALELAARNREQGTVALLAAAGMQTGGWAGVPPANLYRILLALRQVGLDYEARMIAAEAIARS